MNELNKFKKKIPFHLQRIKKFSRLYNQEQERLNRTLTTLAFKTKGLKLFVISECHHRNACNALHCSANPARALAHLQQMHYLGIKGFKRMMLSDNQTLDVCLLGETLTLQELPPEYCFLSGADWFIYFWSALLHGQDQDLDYLFSIKDRDLFNWADPAEKMFIDILARFLKYNDINMQEAIQAYVNASEFDKVSPESYDHIAHIQLPTLDVMLKVFGGADQDSYRQVMHKAALAHNKFWKQKRLQGIPSGDISLPLSALARIAYQRFGYTLGFECDYIPEYFYQSETSEISFELMPLLSEPV